MFIILAICKEGCMYFDWDGVGVDQGDPQCSIPNTCDCGHGYRGELCNERELL